MRNRLSALLRAKGLAAVVAQVWQAVGSFGLQLSAAWILGAAGLGLVSLCLGIIVLTTAVVSGMVGDTLVIRDRHDRGLRAGLQFWTLVLGIGSALIASTVMAVTGLLTVPQAVVFGAALLVLPARGARASGVHGDHALLAPGRDRLDSGRSPRC